MNTKRIIKKLISPNIIILFKELFYKYKCPVCENSVRDFLPLPKVYFENQVKYNLRYRFDQLETLNYLKYRCPICKTNDRDRLYVLYLRKVFVKTSDKNYKLIDFAPSLGLSPWLKKLKNISYRSADLYKEDVDDKVDISDMKIYSEGQFDIFICSHILEHVKDPNKALSELYRITSNGGWGIIMVPLVLGLEFTQEDSSHTSSEERWKNYLQDDHLRLYGKTDFIKSIEGAGFSVDRLDVNFFGKRKFDYYGISQTSVLYIAKKIPS